MALVGTQPDGVQMQGLGGAVLFRTWDTAAAPSGGFLHGRGASAEKACLGRHLVTHAT